MFLYIKLHFLFPLTLSLPICVNRMTHWLPNSLPGHVHIIAQQYASICRHFSWTRFDHHEEFVGERYIPLSYDTKIIGLSILLPLTLFHKNREPFVHKCVAFHSTNGYWKDWLVLRLISIIATCRLGYTIREIRVWTEKKEQNSVSLFRHSNRGLITKATIGSPVGKRPPFAKRVQNIWEVLQKC